MPDTEAERQQIARLHCLYGAPRHGWDEEEATQETLAYARARVYNLRHYTVNTKWGPFKNDDTGDVDWEKMEAIMTVLGYNLKLFSDQTNKRFKMPSGWTEETAWTGASPYSFVFPKATSAEMEQETDANASLHQGLIDQDPYGVTGAWHRIVCFLDYQDFFHFNFRTESWSEQNRQYLDNTEAIRLIVMRFRVTKVEQQEDGVLPIVHFAGDSHTMGGAPGGESQHLLAAEREPDMVYLPSSKGRRGQ